MPRAQPQKLAHIVYRTRRLPEMLAWYEQVFGARVQCQNPALAFLTFDDEHHRLALVDLSVVRPDEDESDRGGLVGVDHVAYTYASLEDLLSNYEAFKAQGIEPYWCVHHGLTVSMYYADPDGNQMEFQVSVFDTDEEANDYICGPDFAANPVGIEFDPDDWLSRLRAGTLASELTRRAADGPASPIRGALAN